MKKYRIVPTWGIFKWKVEKRFWFFFWRYYGCHSTIDECNRAIKHDKEKPIYL